MLDGVCHINVNIGAKIKIIFTKNQIKEIRILDQIWKLNFHNFWREKSNGLKNILYIFFHFGAKIKVIYKKSRLNLPFYWRKKSNYIPNKIRTKKHNYIFVIFGAKIQIIKNEPYINYQNAIWRKNCYVVNFKVTYGDYFGFEAVEAARSASRCHWIEASEVV